MVTQCISRLCTSGDHLVIASIHQPRAAIWDLFNRVVLLSEGYTLYCGPTADVRPLLYIWACIAQLIYCSAELLLCNFLWWMPGSALCTPNQCTCDRLCLSQQCCTRLLRACVHCTLTAVMMTPALAVQVVEWFCTGPTKSQYIPELHGTPCEWLADLISVTFEKIRSHEAEKEGTQSVGFSLEVGSTTAFHESCHTTFSPHKLSGPWILRPLLREPANSC